MLMCKNFPDKKSSTKLFGVGFLLSRTFVKLTTFAIRTPLSDWRQDTLAWQKLKYHLS